MFHDRSSPRCRAEKYGRIVNVSSIAGKEGNLGAPAYSSTKAAVLALIKSMRREIAAHDIGANAVTPVVAKTTLALGQAAEFLRMILGRIPRARTLDLSDAASIFCFLASAESSLATAAFLDLSW